METEKKALFEDYGSAPVPKGQTKGWFGIGIVYWGIAVCLPAFLLSGMIGAPLTLGSAALVYILGSAVLALVAVLSGIIGAHTGLSTGISITYTFGTRGAYVLQLVLFFASWGWFGVQLGFMATGLGDGGLSYALGGAVPGWILQVVGGILMIISAMIGFKAIEKISTLAMPFLLIVLLTTIFRQYSGDVKFSEVAFQSSPNALPIGLAISIVISSFILGALIAPDITRYAKNTKAAGVGMGFGMLIGFPVVLILAAIMVKGAGGEPDFSKVMLANKNILWSILAVFTITLAAWTTNHTNLYSGALSLNAMFPKVNKGIITIISGVVGTLLALAGINTSAGFQTFLSILAIVLPPAAAVMLVDFYFFRGKFSNSYKPEDMAKIPKVRALPLIAWALGSAMGFIVQYTALRLTTITAIDTMIISAVVYFIISTAAKKQSAVQV